MKSTAIQTCSCKFVFPFQTLQQSIVQKIQEKLSSSTIQILFSSQKQQNTLVSVWRYMQSCSTPLIDVSYNNYPTILKQIEQIEFTSLKQLSLCNNVICNIQSLILIDAKQLQQLSLNQNRIANVSCLKKNCFPKLETVNLKQNPISSLKGIEFINLKQLRIQDSAYDKPIGQENINFLLKTLTPKLKILRIQSYHRIKTPKIDEMFKNKNIGIWIYRTKHSQN